jgi:lantibiotic modifying enzyme
MRQALSRADAVPRSDRLGAYAGWAGIALAAARVAKLLDSAEMLDGASHLTRRLIAHREESAEFDLIGGRAGAIIALLCLRASLAEPAGLETAVRLGDELLDAAEWSGGECSWAAPAYPHWRNLTGFSHGTAGVAIALLELYAETGEIRFREAAHAALAYERHWFDAAAGNWPDFRETSRRSARDVPFSFCTFWCHGAPGIALSRLRAREILGDAVFEAEARTALATTRRALEEVLCSGVGNFSLCHGVAGNADVLLHGLQTQPNADARDRETVVQAAELGRRNYDGTARPWPCGTHAGETPNLMLGLAGIGYFYLRLSDPATPSVLMIGRAT